MVHVNTRPQHSGDQVSLGSHSWRWSFYLNRNGLSCKTKTTILVYSQHTCFSENRCSSPSLLYHLPTVNAHSTSSWQLLGKAEVLVWMGRRLVCSQLTLTLLFTDKVSCHKSNWKINTRTHKHLCTNVLSNAHNIPKAEPTEDWIRHNTHSGYVQKRRIYGDRGDFMFSRTGATRGESVTEKDIRFPWDDENTPKLVLGIAMQLHE